MTGTTTKRTALRIFVGVFALGGWVLASQVGDAIKELGTWRASPFDRAPPPGSGPRALDGSG